MTGKYSKYVRWWLMLHRLPANEQASFAEFINKYELYCTYNGVRHRAVFASRMGDLGLNPDFKATRYSLRVDIDQCSDFGPTP